MYCLKMPRLVLLEPSYSTIADVYTLEELKAAGDNPRITEINLLSSISDINEEIDIMNGVMFNGNGNTLTFTSTGRNLIFFKDSDIKNLTVVSNGTDNWTSTYTTQLFNGKYTVSDCNFEGGNGGLLVLSADVTLDGTVNVSNNTFGGIEVSKGSGEGLNGSTLTIKGTILNSTEDTEKPTAWIDGVNDGNSIVGGNLYSNDTKKDDQILYYLEEVNAQ